MVISLRIQQLIAGTAADNVVIPTEINGDLVTDSKKLTLLSLTTFFGLNIGTALNTPSTVAKRDGSGNFAAGTITATLTGTATTISTEASTTVKGKVELATDAETITGTDATRSVTPASLQAKDATYTGGVPIGTILDYAGTLQTNYLLCNAASLDTTTYATLFAKIGYTYGGSGANFTLPDGDKYFRGTGANALGVELADVIKTHLVNSGCVFANGNNPAPYGQIAFAPASAYSAAQVTASPQMQVYDRYFGDTETRPVTLVVTKMIKYQ